MRCVRPMLTCPVCALPLRLDGGTYRCDQGHAFDRAREGYVDLLPVGHGKSGISGDTREMARARQRFLERGHYGALLERLGERLTERAAARPPGNEPRPFVVAEAGCGTGHYIGALAGRIPRATGLGFDVSREALRIAARSHPDVTFARNDVSHRLCLADASVDALLDVFAPRNPAEFRRVLRPDGLLVVAIPGPGHLAELRERLPLLEVGPDKRTRLTNRMGPSFELVWEDEVRGRVDLDRAGVVDVVRMSPSAHHVGPNELERHAVAGRVTLSFVVLGWEVQGPPRPLPRPRPPAHGRGPPAQGGGPES